MASSTTKDNFSTGFSDLSLSDTKRTKLIVGIDYGTTYSGISFVHSTASDFKEITPFTAWPGGPRDHNAHLSKAPSQIAYASENPDLKGDAWGYEVAPGMRSYSWTKLLLDQTASLEKLDDPSLSKAAAAGVMRVPKGKTAQDVVTDYLRFLYKMLEKAINEKMTYEIRQVTPTEFWLTVPAIWSDRAKAATRDAARAVGFGARPGDQLNLIPEPEAAAQLALRSSIHHTSDLVKPKTGILVCDCGGGTVDVTSYTIDSVSPRLQLTESCVGNGAKCGGTYIDRNLYQILAKRFGTAFTSLPADRIGPGSRFMTEFEDKKKNFGSGESSRRTARLQLIMKDLQDVRGEVPGYDKAYCEVLLSYEDMEKCFSPVVSSIIKLLEQQTKAVIMGGQPEVETIILVGGLGASPYLHAKIQEWCDKRAIRLTTPWHGAWSAVVCGAVLQGLEGSSIRKRKCRRHYGFAIKTVYNPLKHSAHKAIKWLDPFDNKDYISIGEMAWAIAKGDTVDSSTELTSEFSYTYANGDSFSRTEETLSLYACNLEKAPENRGDPNVDKIGEILIRLDNIPSSAYVYNKDKSGYCVEFTLAVRLGAKEGTLQFNVLSSGKTFGSATIAFDENASNLSFKA